GPDPADPARRGDGRGQLGRVTGEGHPGADERVRDGVLLGPPGGQRGHDGVLPAVPDRKSTRLNSSHVKISYAVFCLKTTSRRRDSLPLVARAPAAGASPLALHAALPIPPPRPPIPPAAVTAAASSGESPAKAIPAQTNGYGTAYCSVSLVDSADMTASFLRF